MLPEKCNNETISLQHKIIDILENKTTPFTNYLELNIPRPTYTQREKKLKEYDDIISIMNTVLPQWTGITHNTSHMRTVNYQQETLMQDLITQIPANNESAFLAPSYLLVDFPHPYYINPAFFASIDFKPNLQNITYYKESDLKKYLTYINFDPIQPSIISLYQKAIKNRVDSLHSAQFQNIYTNCLLGYMNGVKMLYKTLIMGELIKQIGPNSENIHLLLEEFADQITHHSLITYIQKSGIVFPLPTVTILKKNNHISLPNDEEIKDVLTFLSIGADKKKKYDGIAQHLADQELKTHLTSQNNKYQQTNDLLQRLSTHGYDFSPLIKHGFARITDEQTKEDTNCALDIIVYEGNQSTWKKVWHDMQGGVWDDM